MGNSKQSMLSFKDFQAIQYAGAETDQQDRNAFKRHHGVVGEETPNKTSTDTDSSKKPERGLRRAGMKRLRPKLNDAGSKRNRASDRAGL